MSKVAWSDEIAGVQPRIDLLRSSISDHSYLAWNRIDHGAFSFCTIDGVNQTEGDHLLQNARQGGIDGRDGALGVIAPARNGGVEGARAHRPIRSRHIVEPCGGTPVGMPGRS
jgi:hypothetical protein